MSNRFNTNGVCDRPENVIERELCPGLDGKLGFGSISVAQHPNGLWGYGYQMTDDRVMGGYTLIEPVKAKECRYETRNDAIMAAINDINSHIVEERARTERSRFPAHYDGMMALIRECFDSIQPTLF